MNVSPVPHVKCIMWYLSMVTNASATRTAAVQVASDTNCAKNAFFATSIVSLNLFADLSLSKRADRRSRHKTHGYVRHNGPCHIMVSNANFLYFDNNPALRMAAVFAITRSSTLALVATPIRKSGKRQASFYDLTGNRTHSTNLRRTRSNSAPTVMYF